MRTYLLPRVAVPAQRRDGYGLTDTDLDVGVLGPSDSSSARWADDVLVILDSGDPDSPLYDDGIQVRLEDLRAVVAAYDEWASR